MKTLLIDPRSHINGGKLFSIPDQCAQMLVKKDFNCWAILIIFRIGFPRGQVHNFSHIFLATMATALHSNENWMNGKIANWQRQRKNVNRISEMFKASSECLLGGIPNCSSLNMKMNSVDFRNRNKSDASSTKNNETSSINWFLTEASLQRLIRHRQIGSRSFQFCICFRSFHTNKPTDENSWDIWGSILTHSWYPHPSHIRTPYVRGKIDSRRLFLYRSFAEVRKCCERN